MNIQNILAVSQVPVMGIKGEILIPVSREAESNFRSARAFMVAYHWSEKVVDYFSKLARTQEQLVSFLLYLMMRL